MKIKATNVYVLENRGNVYRKLERFHDALLDFNKSLELEPLNSSYVDSDDYDSDVKRNHRGYDEGFIVTQQMQGERNFASVFSKRGETYLKLDKYEEALNDFNKALELQNEHYYSLKKRAYIYWKLNKLDSALNDINKFLELKPNYLSGIRLRDNILQDIQRIDERLLTRLSII